MGKKFDAITDAKDAGLRRIYEKSEMCGSLSVENCNFVVQKLYRDVVAVVVG